MAHLLVVELPGGNDFDVIETALGLGHRVTFVTGDLAHYRRRAEVSAWLDRTHAIVEVPGFDYALLEELVLAIHAETPIEALLCLIDIRMVEASRLARRLSLHFLNPDSAARLRDKFSVRQRLLERGIPQPRFALATSDDELRAAVDEIGLPVLVKPSDGYGSQNIVVFRSSDDLIPLFVPFEDYLPSRTDYGLGVQANDRLLVERFIEGVVIGCDTFSRDGEHRFLGINEKRFFPLPSFAIEGGCFPSENFDEAAVRDYVFRVLDALDFDCGAAHTELLVSPEGIWLVEVNARLVGAQIPRLLGYALDRSLHAELIKLHLGLPLDLPERPSQFAVSRWIVAESAGIIESIELPETDDKRIRCVALFKRPGDPVRPPIENADRIGYVMTVGATRQEAERIAEEFVRAAKVTIVPG